MLTSNYKVVSVLLCTLVMVLGTVGVRAENPVYLQIPNVLKKAQESLARGEQDRTVQLLSGKTDRMTHPKYQAVAYGLLCVAHYQQQDYTQAEGFCHRAVNTGYSSWSDRNNRGVMRFRLGRYADALTDFKAAALTMLTARSEQKRSVRYNIASAKDRIDAS